MGTDEGDEAGGLHDCECEPDTLLRDTRNSGVAEQRYSYYGTHVDERVKEQRP